MAERTNKQVQQRELAQKLLADEEMKREEKRRKRAEWLDKQKGRVEQMKIKKTVQIRVRVLLRSIFHVSSAR